MQNLDNIEIIGELNKAEFYPADGEWAAKLIGVYNIDGENWLFFHTRGEIEYGVPSVKYDVQGSMVRVSPRRTIYSEKVEFKAHEGEETAELFRRWVKNKGKKRPDNLPDVGGHKVWVAKFPFPDTQAAELV